MTEFSEKDKNLLLIIFGVGFCLVIGVAILHNYFINKEYPALKREDSINTEWVQNAENNHGALYIELENGLKFRVSGYGASNDKEYPSLHDIVSSRVLVSKHAHSDSITIFYNKKEYRYSVNYE